MFRVVVVTINPGETPIGGGGGPTDQPLMGRWCILVHTISMSKRTYMYEYIYIYVYYMCRSYVFMWTGERLECRRLKEPNGQTSQCLTILAQDPLQFELFSARPPWEWDSWQNWKQ